MALELPVYGPMAKPCNIMRTVLWRCTMGQGGAGVGGDPFDITDLFTSKNGVVVDPSDTSTLFSNTDGTGAVTSDGDRVSYIADASGNGNALIQGSPGPNNALTYRTDGTLHWLSSTADTQWVKAGGFTLAHGAVAIGGVEITYDGSSRNGAWIGAGDSSTNYYGGGPSQKDVFSTFAATARVKVASNNVPAGKHVSTILHDGTNLYAYADNTLLGQVASTFSSNMDGRGLGLFQNDGGVVGFLGNIYGAVVVAEAITAEELSNAKQWVAGRMGIAL